MSVDDRTTALAEREQAGLAALSPEQEAAAIEALDHLIATNDISKFTAKQRVGYVRALCARHGLDPLSMPFQFLTIDSRVICYPTRNATDQIGLRHQISIRKVRMEQVGEMMVVEVEGRQPDGRVSFASKYVSCKDSRGNWLVGDRLANAYAKAETGAKRRLILSMVGFGGSGDEDTRGAHQVWMDPDGNLLAHPTEEQRYLIEHPRAARAAGYRTIADADGDDAQFAGPSRVPTTEQLTPPTRSGPRPTFRPTEDDVKRWLGAWFAAVKGTSLDDDEARHRYVRQWTASEGWPAGKQTDSLRTAFARMTEREAGDFLQHVRALVDDERSANEEALAEARRGEPEDESGDAEAF